jgi:hypothetical protein
MLFFAVISAVFATSVMAQNPLTGMVGAPDGSASNVTAKSLIGEYSGTTGTFRPKGVSLIITSVEGNKVRGIFIRNQKVCSGNRQVEGQLDEGLILTLTIHPPPTLGCGENKLRVSVLENGKRMEGEVDAGGVIQKITLTR